MLPPEHATSLEEFDFDQWATLARTRPDAFEELRRLTVELAILKRSRRNRERLKGLQWRIDRLRETAGSPLAACMRISQLMWDRFEDLNDCYHHPGCTLRAQQAHAPAAIPLHPAATSSPAGDRDDDAPRNE